MPRRLAATLSTLAICLGAPTAHAAIVCVDTPAEIAAALSIMQSNGEHDVLRIETGVYESSGGAAAFAYSTIQSFDLTIEGGWVALLGNDCAFRVSNPELTVLSGSQLRQVMFLSGSAGTSGDLTVTNLEFRDGVENESGGGLSIGGTAGYLGDVLVDRVIIRNNFANSFGGGLSSGVDGGTLTIRNSLFLGNECNANNCAMTLTVNAASPTNVRAFIGGNTIVGNACASGAPMTCNTGGVRYGGSARAVFFNNAFASTWAPTCA